MFGFRKEKPIGRLGKIQSFLIYYGAASTETKRRLMETDLAIIELLQWKPEDIADIQASGTEVYGYMSVMETPEWNRKRTSAIDSADLLTEKGSPIRFEEWNSVLMDLRSPGYRSLLLAELDEMVETYALNGVFLDTVGDIEDYVPPALQDEMTAAYRSFLTVAGGRHTDLKWLQNRGFMQLDPCSGLLDGFLWEGFEVDKAANSWLKHWLKALDRHQKNGLTVLSVSDRTDPRIHQAAERNGFIHWTSPIGNYNQL